MGATTGVLLAGIGKQGGRGRCACWLLPLHYAVALPITCVRGRARGGERESMLPALGVWGGGVST